MSIKLLITGGNGQLGWEFAQLKIANFEIINLSRSELDITNRDQITQQLAYWQPDIIVNTAAYTAVDKAEQERELAFKINCDGPMQLAIVSTAKNIPLVHLSTDYVFSGKAQQPYKESDLLAPLNIYGASKLAGEIAVRENCAQHVILRVSGVFGLQGHNFVKTILRLAREKTELNIVEDQIICPTPANKIAEAIIIVCKKILQQNNLWGTYHFCGMPVTNWFKFAETIIDFAKQYEIFAVKKIAAISSKDYLMPAKRPAYSVLDCSKLEKNFSIATCDWQKSLQDVITSLYKK